MYDGRMSRIPRLVEGAWLISAEPVPRDACSEYLMLVRLYEHYDAPGGWTIELFRCQPPQRRADRWCATEAEARAVLAVAYELGAFVGTWRRPVPDTEWAEPHTGGGRRGVAGVSTDEGTTALIELGTGPRVGRSSHPVA
jgi:hypothetical protein